jgi:peptidoglycan/LPS O-acetylase OafA/YrhL
MRSLQAIRACAALLIVMIHTQVTFSPTAGVAAFHGLFSGAGRSVDLFFVLSGFIITFIHAPDWGRPSRIKIYLFNRLSRIYPLVVIVTVVVAALIMAGFGGAYTAGQLNLLSFIQTALLLPQNYPLVEVTWTLKIEIAFYLGFALLIVKPKLGWIFLGVWQTAVVAIALFGKVDESLWYGIYLQPVCLDFCIGMIYALVFMRARKSTPLEPAILFTSLFVGTVAFTVGAAYDTYPMTSSSRLQDVLFFGTSSGLVLTSLVMLESAGRVHVANWLVMLGDASYAIYLVHFSIIGALSRLLLAATKLHRGQINDLTCLAVAAISVAVGVGFYYLVDLPIQRLVRKTKPWFIGSTGRLAVPKLSKSG